MVSVWKYFKHNMVHGLNFTDSVAEVLQVIFHK